MLQHKAFCFLIEIDPVAFMYLKNGVFFLKTSALVAK